MRVLVTGATGNIGQSAVTLLAERGHQVRAMTFSRTRASSAALAHPNVERFHADIRDASRVEQAVSGQEAIVHLAYVIPPLCDEKPKLARAVNLDGTRALLDAASRLPAPPRLLFASSFDLFGHTTHLPPPRRLTDPIQATDLYTEHKLQCEQWVQESALDWLIFRFSDVPVIGFRAPHPIMFEIPLQQRFETLHTLDAGLAIANALERADIWRRIWLIGGGERCQITYGEFLFGMLSVMGIGTLPERAFTTKPYLTDWLDTAESEALLRYQRHSFADILAEVAAISRVQRRLIPFARPFVRRYLLRMSPYVARH